MTGASPASPAPSQSEIVVDGIKHMIMDGRLAPGDRLPIEKDLAARLGVSRGSLREGVRALVVTGVLETRQGDGTYVTALDPGRLLSPIGFLVDLNRPENIADLQSVRRTLETEAAARAALRIGDADIAAAEQVLSAMGKLLQAEPVDHEAVMDADIEFHRIIAAASGNATLAALIEALAGRTVRARLWRAIDEKGVELHTHAEHQAILTALRTRDPDAARLRMGVHLLGVEQYMSGLAGHEPAAPDQ
ncbi:FadR/GntR family transcriptional regulator [Nocardiopsis sediminis]|uniref:FadR/GntR family transcriptional regulator n=1 Tax=Nocardiopsis sediminis TaxID=1778267 RepID=A0ABV8FRG2_9ACTN